MNWLLLTGEYPPAPGGVSDYTRLVARGLAERGERVEVVAPSATGFAAQDAGVRVHRIPASFGHPSGCQEVERCLAALPKPRRLLVQYSPYAFGWRAMNLPFAWWLRQLGERETVWIMFHEVAYPYCAQSPWKHKVLAGVTTLMARLAYRGAERAFVSIPAWRNMLPATTQRRELEWLPVPCNVDLAYEESQRLAIRRQIAADGACVVGHFGTFGSHVTQLLEQVVPALLDARPDVMVYLVGGGHVPRTLQRPRVVAAGRVAAPAAHLAACDLLLQPFTDGVSTRRSSVMAGLALGLPIITTGGAFTEPLWREAASVWLTEPHAEKLAAATLALLADSDRRAWLGAKGATLYHSHFALEHTLEALLDA